MYHSIHLLCFVISMEREIACTEWKERIGDSTTPILWHKLTNNNNNNNADSILIRIPMAGREVPTVT